MQLLVVQEGRGVIQSLVCSAPADRTEIPVGDKPHEIEVAPDGRTAYVSNFGLLEANYQEGTPGNTISVLDIGARTERCRFHLPASCTAPHGLKLRPPSHRELFTNSERGSESMIVFDARCGEVLRVFPLPPAVHNFVFNRDGSALFAFTLTGEVCRINPDTGEITSSVRTGSPRGLAWTADSDHVIVSGRDEIIMLDPADLSVVRHMQSLGVGQVFYPAATPDGRFILAPAVLDGVVVVIDAAAGVVVRRIHTGSPLLLVLSPDGQRVWVSNVLVPAFMLPAGAPAREGGIVCLDLSTFAVTPILPPVPDANGLALVP